MTNLSPIAQAVLRAYHERGIGAAIEELTVELIPSVSAPPPTTPRNWARGFLEAHLRNRELLLEIAEQLKDHWRDRAALAQPEPEGLTDDEILDLSQEHQVSYTLCDGA